MRNVTAQKVASLIEPVLNDLEYELVGVEYGDRGNGMLLRVYIDRQQGISLSDCEAVSRQVSALLDVEDLIAGHYDLEVSSPGLDRPLFTAEQFERFVSHSVKVVMSVAQDGRRRFSGELKSISDGIIVIEVDHERYELPLKNVASARLNPQF